MKQFLNELQIKTNGKSLIDITKMVFNKVAESDINNGLINLSILHTSASLIIQENADSNVKKDILDFFDYLVSEKRNYFHSEEGLDDMPALIKTILTQTNLTLSIKNGKLILGTWQGIFLFEHRNTGKKRYIQLHLIGE